MKKFLHFFVTIVTFMMFCSSTAKSQTCFTADGCTDSGSAYSLLMENSYGSGDVPFDGLLLSCDEFIGMPVFIGEVEKVLSVSPNPFKNHLSIDGLEAGDIVTVYNILGKVIYQVIVKSTQENIDASNWPDGLYLFSIKSGNEEQFIKTVKK